MDDVNSPYVKRWCADCGIPIDGMTSRCPSCAHKHTAKRKAQRRKKLVREMWSASRTCRDCGQPFVLADEEIEFFRARQLVLPSRCVDCRRLRKAAKRAQVD
jgi:hypothetical protein